MLLIMITTFVAYGKGNLLKSNNRRGFVQTLFFFVLILKLFKYWIYVCDTNCDDDQEEEKIVITIT